MNPPRGYGRWNPPRRRVTMPNPMNFDSDLDYYEAMQIWLETAQGKRPRKDPNDYEQTAMRSGGDT